MIRPSLSGAGGRFAHGFDNFINVKYKISAVHMLYIGDDEIRVLGQKVVLYEKDVMNVKSERAC